MIEVEYNIHSLVGLRVTADKSVTDDIDLHLAAFRGAADTAEHLVIIDPYAAAPTPDRDVVIDDIECGKWTLHRGATRVWMAPMRSPSRYAMDRLAWPINLIVQLALLQTGRSFAHASAVRFEGAGVLFPAYPGTGKTTTSAALVQVGGQFLGDDLCVLGDGRIRAYPQALSVYPHHLSILDYSDPAVERAFARGARADRARERLDLRHGVPFKVASRALGYVGSRCVNVMPEDVFGSTGSTREADLDLVITLQRSGNTEVLTPRPIEAAVAARQAAIVLWHEWHASIHELMLLDAVNTNGQWLKALVDEVGSILKAQFDDRPCYRLDIPSSWPNERLRAEFPDFLSELIQQNRPGS